MKTLYELVDELREPKYENLIRLLQNVERLTNKSNMTDIIDELDEIETSEVESNKTVCLKFKDSLIRPDESGYYFCMNKLGHIDTYRYSKVYDAFGVSDYDAEEDVEIFNQNDDIIMWADPLQNVAL